MSFSRTTVWERVRGAGPLRERLRRRRLVGVVRSRSTISTDGREFIAIIATCMAMAAISTDVMLPAFPEMRAEFGLAPDSNEISLVLTTFFFGLALGQVFYGPFSDRFGRKPMLYLGLGIYMVAAIGATFATSLAATAAFRFVWGFGAAAPRSLAVAIVRDSYEGDRMAQAMSQIIAVFILVPVFVPSLSALALTFAPWRIVFWIPVVGAGLVSVWLLRMPETLKAADRRSVGPRSLGRAFKVVVTTRETVAYGFGITLAYGVMFAYVASIQTIIETVYDRDELFPLLFGLIAVVLGLTSLLSGRLVATLGVRTVIIGAAVHFAAASAIFFLVAVAMDGEPPLWAFCVMVAAVLPGVAVIIPTGNAAAMAPVPHVAGMAAAALGTLATGGGALLGAVVDAAFDGTVTPFATGAVVYAGLTAVVIVWTATRTEAVVSAL